jgi:hypothetical protein
MSYTIVPGKSLPSTFEVKIEADNIFREPPMNIPDLEHYHDHFKARCKALKIDIHRKVAMLPETNEWFDDNGDLLKDKLLAQRVEPKAWWY